MTYGHVCFGYSKKSPHCWVISKITKSKWSHVFITIPPILGKETVLEAVANGVQITMFDTTYRHAPNETYEVYKFSCDINLRDKSILNRMKDLHVSYGLLEYPWLFWRILNNFFGRDIKSQDNWCQNGTKICSQVEREYIEDCGFKDLFLGYGKGSVIPQDIYNIVKNNPKIFELIETK